MSEKVFTCATCSDTGAAPCDVDAYPRGICPSAPPNWRMDYGPGDLPTTGPISILTRSAPHLHPCHRCGISGSALNTALSRARSALFEALEILEGVRRHDATFPDVMKEINEANDCACSALRSVEGRFKT